jgi:hypothetical protein
MSSRLLTCLFAATALLSVGCDDSTGLDDDEAATVRVVNASSVVGDLDVALNGNVQPGASDVAFLNAGGQCVRVDADDPQFELEQTGGTVTLPNTNFTFTEGGRNTVIVSGTSAANLRVTTIEDEITDDLAAGEARIRVVNARTVTTPIDVTITPWNATSGTFDEDVISAHATNATSTNVASGWVEVPANGTVQVRVTNAVATGTGTGSVVDIVNIIPRPGEELTIVAVDPAAGNTGLRWIVSPACGRP